MNPANFDTVAVTGWFAKDGSEGIDHPLRPDCAKLALATGR